MIRVPDGTLRILVQGLRRIRLEEPRRPTTRTSSASFVERPRRRRGDAASSKRYCGTCRACSAGSSALVPYLPEELQLAAANVDDPSALCNLVASTLRLKTEEKQQLLEVADVEAAAARGLEDPQPRARGRRARDEDPVAGAVGAEQGAARVLPPPAAEGDPGGARRGRPRAGRGRASCASGSTTPTCRRRCARRPTASSARLERLPSAAAEYGVIRTYLDWLATLPWGDDAPTTTSTSTARAQILDEDHYDLEKVKERILEHLAVSKLKQRSRRADPLLRRAARRRQDLARPVDRPHARSASSRGISRRRRPRRGRDPRPPPHLHRRDARARSSARCATPSRTTRCCCSTRSTRWARDFRGDPASGAARGARPGAERDLPRPLPRPAVRPLEGPLHLHGEHARHDPAGRCSTAWTCSSSRATPRRRSSRSPSATSCRGSSRSTGSSAERIDDRRARRCGSIIREYTREAGVRELERRIGDLCRKAARRFAERQRGADRRSTERARARPARAAAASRAEARQRTADPGVATGLAYTRGRRRRALHRGAGATRARGRLTVTGQLGDVMQESAQAALSWVRSHTRAARRSTETWFARARRPHPRARPARCRRTARRPGSRWRRRSPRSSARRRCADDVGDDRRDHAHRPGAAGRRHPREGARGPARRPPPRHPAARERARPRRAAGGDARASTSSSSTRSTRCSTPRSARTAPARTVACERPLREDRSTFHPRGKDPQMINTKEKVADAAASARPYVERALRDEELRDNIRNAYSLRPRRLRRALLPPQGLGRRVAARRRQGHPGRDPERDRRDPERGRPRQGREAGRPGAGARRAERPAPDARDR